MSFDPTNRELCPDGMCVGVIGSDGCCKVCGAVAASVHTHSRLRGMKLHDAADAENDGDASDAGHGGDDRELCPDGACIGLIGADGRCKECGRPGEGAAAAVQAEPATTERATRGPAAATPSDDIDDRELCPDGMCVGVIGADGRCKVCGTARA